MQLKLGFSTCPNDTFMFDAMVNKRIDTEGFSFLTELADIEKLNQHALAAEFDVIKISYALYPKVSEHYQILNSGSALGHANGPLLVSKHKIYPDEVESLNIAIPGANTTANLLLDVAFPKITSKKEYLFSDIEDVVLSGEADAGLLIHENRFTYEERGLKKIIDLGTWWEEHTKLPIPLGGIVVRRSLPQTIKEAINRVLYHSVEFAMENPKASHDYIKQHAQSMKDDVVMKHINLYVNQYSVDLGMKGREAIEGLFDRATALRKITNVTQPIFAISK
jgi:Predicted periplasmic solute-binding protein